MNTLQKKYLIKRLWRTLHENADFGIVAHQLIQSPFGIDLAIPQYKMTLLKE